jgi:hypothetical protein
MASKRGRKKSAFPKNYWVHFRVKEEEYVAIKKRFGSMLKLRDYVLKVVMQEDKAVPGGSA